MNKDNRKRKMAIGAVVAAGMTTGAMAVVPSSEAPKQEANPEVELTAADQVVIEGEQVDFDQLIAQLPPQVRNDRVRLMYGVRPKMYGPPPRRPDVTDKVDTVGSQIIKIASGIAKVPTHRVSLGSRLQEDLSMNKVAYMELIIAIEREFNIVVTEEAFNSMKTVGDVVNYIKSVK